MNVFKSLDTFHPVDIRNRDRDKTMTVAVKIHGYDDGVCLPFHEGGGAGGYGGVKKISGGTGGNRRNKSFSHWVRPYLWSWRRKGGGVPI